MEQRKSGKMVPVDRKPLRDDAATDKDVLLSRRTIADAPVTDHPVDVHLPDENEDLRGPKAFPGGK